MDQEKSFLGKGWSFPPTFNKEVADVEMVSKEEDIKQSLHIYFSTRLGERIMRSDYGCIIHDYFFISSNDSAIQALAIELQRSLRNYEPRIIVHNVSAKKSDSVNGLVTIGVDYEIQSNNVRDNIVYPFYINEGTEIK